MVVTESLEIISILKIFFNLKAKVWQFLIVDLSDSVELDML